MRSLERPAEADGGLAVEAGCGVGVCDGGKGVRALAFLCLFHHQPHLGAAIEPFPEIDINTREDAAHELPAAEMAVVVRRLIFVTRSIIMEGKKS